MTSVVTVEGLRKTYGDVERLHGLTFEVDAGQIFGFLGTNGAGKTTTIEILEGYRSRNAGSVSVLGADPARADRAWRNRIGLVRRGCNRTRCTRCGRPSPCSPATSSAPPTWSTPWPPWVWPTRPTNGWV